MKISCIVVDDEPLAIEKLRQYISRVEYLALKATFDNAADAANYLKNIKTDLVFLDIQMEDLTGIQMLESVKIDARVILTTAYDQYALKGYELSVSDYLLKPISFQRFLKAVDKIHDQVVPSMKPPEDEGMLSHAGQKADDFFFVKTEYRIEKINFDEILFIEGMKDYLRIWTTTKKVMTLQSFQNILSHLPDDNFVRVHKSWVVSIRMIDSIHKNRIVIRDQEIPVGESYKKYFFELLRQKKLLG